MTEIPMIHREPSRRALVIPLPSALHLLLAVLLSLSLMVVMVSVLISFRLGDMMARPNPFTAYESLWPGQPIADMVAFRRRAPSGFVQSYTESSGATYPGQVTSVTYETNPPPENM